jgi:hypothetical protein
MIAITNHSSDDFLSFTNWLHLNDSGFSLGVNRFQLLLACIPLLAYLIYMLAAEGSKSKNKKLMSDYQKKIEVYKQQVADYLTKVEKLQSDDKITVLRKDQTESYLKSSTVPDLKVRDVNKGRFEDYFYKKLQASFGDKVYNNLQLGYFENPYVPDFVFADNDKKLFIDIEIDEPYVLENKEPIHYVGKDDYRDSFFLDNHWIIVRFSEDQIASNADDCCKQIENVILHILNNDKLQIKVQQVEQWTQEEAQLMAKNNHRLKKY